MYREDDSLAMLCAAKVTNLSHFQDNLYITFFQNSGQNSVDKKKKRFIFFCMICIFIVNEG